MAMPNPNRILLICIQFAAFALTAAGADTRLLDAVRSQDKALALTLLQEKKQDVNAAAADGATALQWAAHWDDIELADRLLQAGSRASAANLLGITPLHLACENGSAAMVKRLLDGGANPNARAEKSGVTPLMYCAKAGSAAAVNLLINRGAEVNAVESRRGQNALMWAISNHHADVVRALIEHRSDFRAKSKGNLPAQYGNPERKSGFSPLLFAARYGDVAIARVLLDAGADVNEATPEDGSALVVAATGGHEKLALLLLERGADPKATDAYGATALHYAARPGMLELTGFEFYAERLPPPNLMELVGALLDRGADPNAQMKANFPFNSRYHEGQLISLIGATPLMLAAHTADVALVKLLLDRGANPALTTKSGDSALLLASGMVRDPGRVTARENEQALETVKLLAGRGADLNHSNGQGQTALHAAASVGANALIQFLATGGAKVNARNKSGETPWSVAMALCPAEGSTNACGAYVIHKDTAELLRSLGAETVAPERIDRYAPQQ